MTDVCVCGHGRIEHQPNGNASSCPKYRAVLDWPNEEGLWWCSNGRGYKCERVWDDLVVLWDDGDYHTASSYLACCTEQLRFTKCEPNPFEKP